MFSYWLLFSRDEIEEDLFGGLACGVSDVVTRPVMSSSFGYDGKA